MLVKIGPYLKHIFYVVAVQFALQILPVAAYACVDIAADAARKAGYYYFYHLLYYDVTP